MKLFVIFLLLNSLLLAQSKDSILINELDVLIINSVSYFKKEDLVHSLYLIDSAETLYYKSKIVNKKILGTILLNKGNIYSFQSKYSEAEKLFHSAMSCFDSSIGRDNNIYAWCLFNLALVYINNSRNNEAEILIKDGIVLFEKYFGNESNEYAKCLDMLGMIYADVDFEKSKFNYLKAYEIKIKYFEKDNLETTSSLNNLGNLYNVYGYYEDAKKTLEKCLTIRNNLLGNQHSEYLKTLNNLAVLYEKMGHYQLAEQKLLECAELKFNKYGENSESYAVTLNNLGSLYWSLGNKTKAEKYLTKAFEIRSKILNIDNISYLKSLTNLGSILVAQKKYSEGENYLLRAYYLYDSIFGNSNIENVNVLCNLAILKGGEGNFLESLEYYFLAKSRQEKKGDTLSPDYANILSNMAELYLKNNFIENAYSLASVANSIYSSLLGLVDQTYFDNLKNICLIEALRGNYENRDSIILELSISKKEFISKASMYLSISEFNKYLSSFEDVQSMEYSFASSSAEGRDSLLGDLYNNAIFFKNISLNISKHNYEVNDNTEESKSEIIYCLRACQRNLSYEFTLPISERVDVPKYEQSIDSLERLLIQNNANKFIQSEPNYSWSNVKNLLKGDEIAVEIIQYSYYNPMPTDSILYAAILLKSNLIKPIFVPLFNQEALGSAIEYEKDDFKETTNKLYTSNNENVGILFDLIIKPLKQYLKDVNTIYFSSTGLLNRINLSAIPIGKNKILSDVYTIVAIGSTRDINRFKQNNINNYNNCTSAIYGNISFDQDTIQSYKNAISMNLNSYTSEFTSNNNIINLLRGDNWSALEGTKDEIISINKTFKSARWNTIVKTDTFATEESIKKLANCDLSPKVIHIATHGFYYPNTLDTSSISSDEKLRLDFRPQFIVSENPMIRSGLLFAGCNYAWKNGFSYNKGNDDGILTAFEVSQLNLSNTELVVLSACETALGDIQGNEGVFGLQRAFKMAGVENLIISLWKISDIETVYFMNNFYKNWITKKMTIPEAFRKTQLKMRKKYIDPIKWAGFVLIQ